MSQPWTPPPPPQDNPPYGQLNYATWADRVLAALIDAGIVFAAVVIIYIGVLIITAILQGIGLLASQAGDTGGAVGGLAMMGGCGIGCVAFILIPLVAIGIGLYNKVYLVSKRGSSIGQGIMKLKVVMPDGGPVPTGTLVLRLLVQMGFSIIPFLALLSLLWPLWDPQRQALHDKAVGTFVIKVG